MRARIRSIKPEVHLDEELWDLEQRTAFPIFRLFVGLWNYADRDGRFEWRPRALRTVILPYWGGDFEAAMSALAEAGFVVRYDVAGRLYGLVRTFSKHQVINNREEKSTLPAPPDASLTREARVAHASPTRADASPESDARVTHAGKDAGSGEGKGREGNGLEGKGSNARARDFGVPVHSDSDAPPNLDAPSSREHSRRLIADLQGMQLAWSSEGDRLVEARQLSKIPPLTHAHLRQAADGAARSADSQGITREEAAATMVRTAFRTALERGRLDQVGFLLVTLDPWAPAGAQAPSRARPGRVEPAPGTTAADFAGVSAADVERQLRDIGRPVDE